MMYYKNKMQKLRKVAITIGEPGGIGPEVAVRTAADRQLRRLCVPVLIGDAAPVQKALDMLSLPLKLRAVSGPSEEKQSAGYIDLIPMGAIGRKFKKGAPTTEGGAACYEYIKKGVQLALSGEVSAVCTAPISKEALKMAGVPYPGHTEMLADITGAKKFAMMLIGGPLRVVLVTTHAAIKDVPGLINRKAVFEKILLAQKAAKMLAIGRGKARIAVCGLNPHAGEAGLFGEEEIRHIAPAVRQAKEKGVNAIGPAVPDAIFRKAYMGEVDIIVAMYHDQGLIPLKMIAFDTGVNVTVGLPIIRTSPDHGTAYDIAWKGLANPASMIEAVKTALSLKI